MLCILASLSSSSSSSRFMSFFPLVLLLLLLVASHVHAGLDNNTSPTSVFRSRPDLHAPIIDLEILYPDHVAPGYVFLAPYRNTDPGPYIYDNDGQLVWSGAGTQGSSTSHNPHVCEYKGEDHICFFQGHQHHGWARGHGVIMDNRYRVVQTVEAVGAASTTDMHEFRLIDHGTKALVTIYQPRPYDLGPFGVGPGMGWIQDSVFQEIDVDTGELLFEWRALDHVAPSFSYTCIGCTDTSGDGLSRDTPWDFFHINSIDKNDDGDYLISARHVAAVYKISGKDGSIIWELNGANPTFRNDNLHFSSQHHALWVKENQTHSIISMFDNASNTFNITNHESRGMLIGIDHIANTATKMREWLAPEEKGILAGSQGNMQLLPGRNVFIGWGDHAFYSEHLDSGEVVMYGKLAYWGSDVMMYRCNKHPWVGRPLTVPSLFSYSKTATNDSATVFYVSWNGATEVRSWNFYLGDSAHGPWTLAGSAPRRGFETEHHHHVSGGGSKQWAVAEALDAEGKVLKKSSAVRTFIPTPLILDECDDRGCNPIPPLKEGEQFDKTTPEVPHRGANWTKDRGYDTASYYYPADVQLLLSSAASAAASAVSRDGLPLSKWVLWFALALGVLLAVVVYVLGKRRAVRLGAFCWGWVKRRVFGVKGAGEGEFVLFSPTYSKVEGGEEGGVS